MRPFLLSERLGSRADCDEFQVQDVIVFVRYPPGERAVLLDRANQYFDAIWNEIPQVKTLALLHSRQAIPEFWADNESTDSALGKLVVIGIWIDPESGSADYEVACLHESFPADGSIDVHRDAEGNLSVA